MSSMKSRKSDVDAAGRQPEVLSNSNQPRTNRNQPGERNKNTKEMQMDRDVQGGGGGKQGGGGRAKTGSKKR